MPRSRSVASFASHVDFRPGRLVGICFDVIILFQVGGVALGTHAVPVLTGIGPIQPVLWVDGSFRVEMIPLFLFYIPGNGQTLQPSAGEGNQVLLQGIGAEGVFDFKVTHFAIRPLGMDVEATVLAVKT